MAASRQRLIKLLLAGWRSALTAASLGFPVPNIGREYHRSHVPGGVPYRVGPRADAAHAHYVLIRQITSAICIANDVFVKTKLLAVSKRQPAVAAL
jgi:hypothetical protein